VRNRLSAVVLLALGLLTVHVALFAHHGTAVYDTAKLVTVKGRSQNGPGPIRIACWSLMRRTTKETSCIGLPRRAVRRI
jgi:hypothetical protein